MNAASQLGMAARIISRWGKDWHAEGKDKEQYASAHNDVMDLADTVTKQQARITDLETQLAAASKKKKNAAQLINQTSGDFEYYTPSKIVDAARRVMGRIDLDPASSAIANERVKAAHYYTEADDGLAQEWYGRVWMNHPFGRVSNPLWINKLIAEYHSGNVEQACCITYACTSESWFQPLNDFPMCFLSPRTNYYLPDGTLKRGVSKGSAVTYMGPNWGVELFIEEFRKLGRVMLP